MDKPFIELSSVHFKKPSKPAQPHVDGYRPHEDIEMSKKFPRCCDFHAQTIKVLEEWFKNYFPQFSTEEEEAYKWWFRKSDFKSLPLKIVTQLSYTEYFIRNKISSNNWFNAIRHYIDYNITCFGMPAFGFMQYTYMVKYYIQNVEKEIVEEKRKIIIAYLDNKLKPQVEKNENKDKTDFNIIYATIQKWLNIFPFDMEEFYAFKKLYERKWLIIVGVGDYNPYTRSTLIQPITKPELINLLITTTKELLNVVNGAIHVKKGGSIQQISKYKLGILVENHSFKQNKLLNDFSPGEYSYINILEKWFENEKEFLDGYLGFINSSNKELPVNSKSNYLSTFNTSFSKIQLEGLRVLLLDRLYISEISNDDFLYLFQSKPIVQSMIKLDWLKPNSWGHYMLKEIVFVGINFNFKQVNNCIIGFEGKKFDSNSNKGGYKEIDDILNLLRK